MKLNAENVHKVLMECLFKKGEDTAGHIVGEGVMGKVGLHPWRLENNRKNIEMMLSELPAEFHVGSGGGWSFLNACFDKDGTQWTDLHATVDKLVMLGSAIGKLKFVCEREYWHALPGGMPYFVVD